MSSKILIVLVVLIASILHVNAASSSSAPTQNPTPSTTLVVDNRLRQPTITNVCPTAQRRICVKVVPDTRFPTAFKVYLVNSAGAITPYTVPAGTDYIEIFGSLVAGATYTLYGSQQSPFGPVYGPKSPTISVTIVADGPKNDPNKRIVTFSCAQVNPATKARFADCKFPPSPVSGVPPVRSVISVTCSGVPPLTKKFTLGPGLLAKGTYRITSIVPQRRIAKTVNCKATLTSYFTVNSSKNVKTSVQTSVFTMVVA
jgi:hypothetical protein